jgi:hypothetical protein
MSLIAEYSVESASGLCVLDPIGIVECPGMQLIVDGLLLDRQTLLKWEGSGQGIHRGRIYVSCLRLAAVTMSLLIFRRNQCPRIQLSLSRSGVLGSFWTPRSFLYHRLRVGPFSKAPGCMRPGASFPNVSDCPLIDSEFLCYERRTGHHFWNFLRRLPLEYINSLLFSENRTRLTH